MSSDQEDTQEGGAAVLATKTDHRKEKRFRWAPLTVESLKQNDIRDETLANYLMNDNPYKAKYGFQKKAWEEMVENINKKAYDSKERLVFPNNSLKVKNAQRRFQEYLDFASRDINTHARRSGEDDEELCSLRLRLSELYEDNRSHQASLAEGREDASKREKLEKEGADALKQASLGLMISDGADGAEEEEVVVLDAVKKSGSGGRKSRSSSRSSTPLDRSGGGVDDSLESIKQCLARVDEAKEDKVARKKAKHELEMERLQLEKDTLDFEKEKHKLAVKKQEADDVERKLTLKLLLSLADKQK